jgi:hypothetical protein
MNELDEMLGLSTLTLSYPVHTEGFDGECFTYSIYFTDGNADETRADAVSKAFDAYDFGLEDDYIGYLDISAAEGKISVYHDFGGLEPESCMTILHGVLLALNGIDGIKKVVINEGGSDFDF